MRSARELLAAMRARGAAPALVVPEGGPSFSYGALCDNVESVAGALAPLVATGAPVATAMLNGPAFLVSFLALARLNRTAMPFNPAVSEETARMLMADAGVRVLLVEPGENGPTVAAARALGATVIETPIVQGQVTLAGVAPGATPPVADAPENVLIVLQTSGTTGKPKRVPLTQRNVCASIEHIAATYALSPADRSLVVMPLFHVHGLVAAALATLATGGSLIVPPKFSASRFWDWTEAHAPTWFTAVPTMYQILLTKPGEMARGRGRFRFVRSCSSALLPQTQAQVEELLGAPLVQAYGMTEAAHQVAANPLPPAARKPGAVGLPTGVELAILDATGRELAVGEAGEVAIKGENVMAGYLDNPEANALSFTHGWFRTGDIGRLDADGYLILVARAKEMINRGGEKIAPGEIDTVLLEVAGVTQAVTFGVADAMYGEVVHAAVVAPGVGEGALLAHCQARLPAFMVPVKLHLVDAIPAGATGKVSRTALPGLLGL